MKVFKGASQKGCFWPKLYKIIKASNIPIEYIAPFLREAYLEIKSIPLTVNSLTTRAPMPLPIKISGTNIVKTPITPSNENEASKTSR
jgi:hypothetical protein